MKNYENLPFSSQKEKIEYLTKLKAEKEIELNDLEGSTAVRNLNPTQTNKSNNIETENSQDDK